VLILSVELPSLTFQRKDISQANLISSILFGDGAAAVIISNKKSAPGPRILVSETYTFPDSLGAMGFDLKDSGFHILLSKDVPEMIGEKIEGLVDGFFVTPRPHSRRHSRLDFASGRLALIGERRKSAGLEQVRYAAFVERPGQCWQSFQRDYSFYSAGMA